MEIKDETIEKKTEQKKEPFSSEPPSVCNCSRRVALRWLGWAGIYSFLAVFGITIARFFYPRLLFEPPTTFKIGFPNDYPIGSISERFKTQFRLWIVREPNKIYVIEAKCTHLGCTPNWLESEGKFKCPCHGSGFTRDGVNVEGPAPRPLQRFKVSMGEDGQILVDKGVVFRGERNEWEKPGAFLDV